MMKDLFLSDSSNSKNIEDSFGIHTKIADTITEIIKSTDLQTTSFNLGLFGLWGSGKSFVVNKIIKNIKNGDFVVFNIDVWKYIGHPLMRSVLFDIDEQIKNKGIEKFEKGYINDKNNSLERILYSDTDFEEAVEIEWKELCSKLAPIIKALTIIVVLVLLFSTITYFYGNNYLKAFSIPLFSGMGFISAPLIFIKLLNNQLKKLAKTIFCNKKFKTFTYKPSFSPEQFEQIFADIVKTIAQEGKKTILIFDNLDRCEPKYAYETLSAIKTFMDKSNCFYIIPCDDSAIKKYITANYHISNEDNEEFSSQIGNEFFDKLFNTYIRIPKLEEVDRDNFIEQELKKLAIYDELKENISELKQILFFGYKGATPRQIKRFINDLSMNYYLAKSIDSEKTFLLNNLPVFAVMVVIKQKWINVEEQLIKEADLFSEKIEDEEYNNFINKVKKLLPNEMPSLLPFIFFKETINEQVISNQLKEGVVLDVVNDNAINRIKIEVLNYIENNLIVYLANSINTIYRTLNQKECTDSDKKKLIQILGETLVQEQFDFASFLIKYQDNINKLFEYMPSMLERNLIKIKALIVSELTPKNKQTKNSTNLSVEAKQKVFNLILNNNIFSQQDIQEIFTNITDIALVDESIKKYIAILFEQNKSDYIPEKFIDFTISHISDNEISQNIKDCLNYFDHISLPDSCKKNLAKKTNTLIETTKNSYPNYTNNSIIISDIIMCLELLSKNSFDEKSLSETNLNMQNIIDNLINSRSKIATQLLLEALYFVNDETCDNLNSIISNYLSYADYRTKLKEAFLEFDYSSYILNAFTYPKIKRALLYQEIVKELYTSAKNIIPEKYPILLSDDFDFNNLKVMINVITEHKININKTEFKKYVLENYLSDDNLEQNYSVFGMLAENDYKIVENDISQYKNKTIDCYKENPQNGIRYLIIAKNILTENQFNKIFLLPLFNKIKSILENTDSISSYVNLLQLINNTFVKNSTQIIKEVIAKLLEDNQDTNEYEFACDLINILNQNDISIDEYQILLHERYNSLNQKSKNIIIKLFPNVLDEVPRD